MKNKLKSLFLGLALLFSAGIFVACKKDPPAKEKVQPVVNIEFEQREFYENDTLSSIDLWLGEGSTEGSVYWVTSSQVLVLGENECEWKFVPKDTSSYHEKTGTVTIEAVEEKETPTVNAYITNEKVFIEKTLSTVNLSLVAGDTAGTVEWVDPSQVLVAGGQICEWKFTPEDTETYKVVYGKIRINAVEQSVVSLEVVTLPSKTAFKPFDTESQVTLSGMVLTARYDGGKVETVTSGWTVSFENGEAVTMADTKVVATYKGVSTEVAITVSKLELNNPQIQGTYVYNGEAQTAVLKSHYYDRYYDLSNATYTNAGTYQITITLNDLVNFKWKNSETEVLTLDFVIQKADITAVESYYEGVFDNVEHSATVVPDGDFDVYYSTTELTVDNYTSGSLEALTFKNAGAYTVYYYVEGDNNHNGLAGQLFVSISKAAQTASVKYAYAIVSENNANIPTSYVKSLDLNGHEIDITGKISFKYYANYNNGSLTTSASGATVNGGAPKNIGTYAVETVILGDDNYYDAVVVSTLVIAPNESFVMANEGERPFAWLSADEDVYAEAKTRLVEGFNELALQMRVEDLKTEYRVYKKDSKWYVEIDEDYEIVYDATNDAISMIGTISGDEFATLEKWDLPYYLGTFERDTVTTDDTTPNSQMYIYNDYGIVRFTFTYYAPQGSNSKSGIVKYIQGTGITFTNNDGSQNITISGSVNVDQEITSLNINFYVPGIKGVYTRV